MPNLTTMLLTDAVDKAWSEEAREAAAEARRAGAQGAKGKPLAPGAQRMLEMMRQQAKPAAPPPPPQQPKERSFTVHQSTPAYNHTTGSDVWLPKGAKLVPVDATDKGTIFRTEQGHEVHVDSRDDKHIR